MPESRMAAGEAPTAPPKARQSSLPDYLARSIFVVASCWLSGAISHALASAYKSHFTYADAVLAVPSLLAGVVVAVLLKGGRSYWPAVFIGLVLARFTQLAADLEPAASAAEASLARHPSVLLRVRAMGARLWEQTQNRVVCDCPL